MTSQTQVYAAVDLETTGSRFSKGDRIFQVGISLLIGDDIVQDYSFLVNPGRPIPPAVERLTGIRTRDVRHAPLFEDVADYIYGLLQGCVFVAHNIQFDYHFLDRSLQATGLPPLDMKGMDTVELTKILFPTLTSYRLPDLSRYFSLEHPKAHDAEGDAHATADLFRFLRKKAVSLPLVTLERLNGLSDSTMMDNGSFFVDCREEAIARKLPLPEGVVVRNGIALRDKRAVQEQTAYRLKAEQTLTPEKAEEYLGKLGLEKRPLQLQMLEQMKAFLREKENESLIVEAPPGIGKSFAYALPSLYEATPEKKVILSTASLLLQNQLLEEGLLPLQEVLPFPVEIASLVSKRHLLHLEKFASLKTEALSGRDRLILMSLYVWLVETASGNLLDLSPSHKTSSLFEEITWKGEEGIAGSWQQDDFYQYNVEKARHASLLVTNHAYLVHHLSAIADFSSTPPALIVDEAHQLPAYFQGMRQSAFPFTRIFRRVARFEGDTSNYREYLETNATQPYPQYEFINFEFSLERLLRALDEGLLILTGYSLREMQEWRGKKRDGAVFLSRESLQLPKTHRFFKQLIQACEEVLLSGHSLSESPLTAQESSYGERLRSFLSRVTQWREQLLTISGKIEESWHAIEFRFENGILEGVFLQSPHEIGADLHASLTKVFERIAYISASLLVQGSDSYFRKKVGEERADIAALDLPVSARQVRVLLPADVPSIQELDEDTLAASVAEMAMRLSVQTGRKILVLLRSNSLLEKVYTSLRKQETIDEGGIELLAQGFSGSTRRTQRRFLEATQAILLASGMYWEGVDFPGSQLELLLIPRLPFDSPESPESQAIHEHFRASGRNAFREEFLPRMLLRLKQGVGRIAREEGQRGVVVCLDERILHSSYANAIQESLGKEVKFSELPLNDLVLRAEKFLENGDV